MKNRLQTFVPAAVASAFAVAAMVVLPLNAIASGSETTWTAGGGDEIGSNSYVLIASDIGESAEGWRYVAFSTADSDYAITSNRAWVATMANSAIGDGATLSFADSSATAWTAGANVVVSGFAESAIRFGASEVGLTCAQRRRFDTPDGKRLYVSSDGYLTTQRRAFGLILK